MFDHVLIQYAVINPSLDYRSEASNDATGSSAMINLGFNMRTLAMYTRSSWPRKLETIFI